MLGSAVCVSHGKTVFQAVAGSGIVGRIVDLFIHDGLDGRILGGVNLKSAAVEQVVGLGFGVAKFFHQCVFHLLGQLISEIAVGSGILLGDVVHHLDTGVDIICQGFFLLLLGDVTLLKHILQDDLALFRIGLLTADGV